MIVIPQNTSVRLALPATSRRSRGLRPLATRFALAIALTLSLPGLAHAATGGVAVTSSSTTGKGSQVDASAAAPTARPKSVGKSQVRRAQTLLRLSPTGSNDTATRKVVKRFQGLRGITAHGIIDLPTYIQIKNAFALLETGGVGVDVAGDPAAGGGLTATDTAAAEIKLPDNLAPITANERAILDKIAQCESKGDPTAVSSDGQYRGKYQFDKKTWQTVGGAGDPATATEVEQDQRAAILLRQRGTAPWPVCGAA
jgi:hypothetical protein